MLRGALDPRVDLLVGDERPEPADYDVLVGGRPAAEDLDASPALRYARDPVRGPACRTTRDLAARAAELAVHNLHHNAPATAEMAVGLLLAAARRIVPADRALRKGDWRIRYGTDSAACVSSAARRWSSDTGPSVAGWRTRSSRSTCAWWASVDTPAGGDRRTRSRCTAPRRSTTCFPRPTGRSSACRPRRDAGHCSTRGVSPLLPRGAVLVNVARGRRRGRGGALRGSALGAAWGGGLDVW